MIDRPSTDVLIIGAGPTGLAQALWLTKAGIHCRIVDRHLASASTSRALVVHARTLELYEQIGIADRCINEGALIKAIRLHVGGAAVARVELGPIGSALSPYPFVLALPQDRHERILAEALGAMGVTIERQIECVSLEQTDEAVVARLHSPHGVEEVKARYLVGCDGYHSKVRKALGIPMPGGTYSQRFFVADSDIEGAPSSNEIVVALGSSSFLAMFPLPGEAKARLIGTLQGPHTDAEDITAAVVAGARRSIGVTVRTTNWLSTYNVHHRVAEHFRDRRVFLAGDAAHVHSPAGGQGLNTGVGDAVNLAWKLAAVIRDGAAPEILDSYEDERRPFAENLVRTTDKAFEAAVSLNPVARVLRLRILPLFWPYLLRQAWMRRFIFRNLSQIRISYRRSIFSTGRAGAIHGGDRMPWCGNPDTFGPIRDGRWHLQIFNLPHSRELSAIAQSHRIPAYSFALTREARRARLCEAYYLVRPDGYIAAIGRQPDELRATLGRLGPLLSCAAAQVSGTTINAARL